MTENHLSRSVNTNSKLLANYMYEIEKFVYIFYNPFS